MGESVPFPRPPDPPTATLTPKHKHVCVRHLYGFSFLHVLLRLVVGSLRGHPEPVAAPHLPLAGEGPCFRPAYGPGEGPTSVGHAGVTRP